MLRLSSTVLLLLPVFLTAACADSTTAPDSPTSSARQARAALAATPVRIASVGTAAYYVNGTAATACLDVSGNSAAPGTPVVFSQCAGRSSQQFTQTTAGELRAMGGTMCVDASGGAGRVGDAIIIWPCHGGANQQWALTANQQLQGINGLCIAPTGAVTAGTGFSLAPCSSNKLQTWIVSPISTVLPRIAAVSPAPADSFVNSIGVNMHLSWLDRTYFTGFSNIVVPKLSALGIRHVRDGGPVFIDQSAMRTVYANYQALATATGAKFTIIVSPKETPAGVAPAYNDASHVRTVLMYAGANNVEAFEGLNEHDQSGHTSWVSETVSMQRALWTTIKSDPSLAPKYTVLGPTVTSSAAVAALGDVTPYMNAAAFHPYPGAGTPFSAIGPNLSKYASMIGGRAPYATETGYPTSMLAPRSGFQPVTEAVAAKYLPRLFLENFNAGIARSFSYELIDEGTDPSDPEQGFGLLHSDGSEKPAYAALRNLIALVADPGAPFTPQPIQFAITGDTSGVHRSVLEKRDGRVYLVLWQEATSYDPSARQAIAVPAKTLTLRFAQTVRAIKIYTPVTSASPTTQASSVSQIDVGVPDHPVVIEVTP